MTEQLQKKIFEIIDLNELFDCFISDSRFIDIDYNVLEILKDSEFIHDIIENWLKKSNLPPEILKFLLTPENEKLITTCQPSEGQKLSECIKLQLCPENFFPLKVAKTVIPVQLQQEIFNLLELEQIFVILEKDADFLKPNCNISQSIKNPVIIEELRAWIMLEATYGSNLVQILAKVPELNTLSQVRGQFPCLSYDELRDSIPKAVLHQKLENIIINNPEAPSPMCPENFFPLKGAGIEITNEQQQRIFNLLEAKQIVKVLMTYNDSLDSSHDILNAINNEKIMDKLRNKIVNKFKTRPKLMEILAETHPLYCLSLILDNQFETSYNSLCKSIQKITAFPKQRNT